MRRRGGNLAVLLVAAVAIALLPAADAGARTIYPYSWSGKFIDGTGSSAGIFNQNIRFVDINQTTGRVYVLNANATSQFDLNGTPVEFPALSPSTHLETPTTNFFGGMAVSTATGNIYAAAENGAVQGFAESGEPLAAPFPLPASTACGLGTDPSSGALWVAMGTANEVKKYSPSGVLEGGFETPNPCHVTVDASGNVYVVQRSGPVRKYDGAGNLQYEVVGGNNKSVAVDPANGNLFVFHGTNTISIFDVSSITGPAEPLFISTFGGADPQVGFLGLQGTTRGLAVHGATHDVYVANTRNYSNSRHVEIFSTPGATIIPTVETLGPEVERTSATLRGTVDPDGGSPTTECVFEWGLTTNYGNVAPCSPSGPFGGSGENEVTAEIQGLTTGLEYHYRLVAANSEPFQSRGADQTFKPVGPPLIDNEAASEVFSDGGRVNADIEPGGLATSYHFEYGTAPCDQNPCTSIPAENVPLPQPIGTQGVSRAITGLTPDTTYHWRLVATNAEGTTEGPDQQFRTFALLPSDADPCDNALVRKQTRASLLPDCRAYELVSASDTGGYDVESSLFPDQTPLAGHPAATSPPRALYTVHYGAIPGVGDPPNLGDDPYVATRTDGGWETRYIGIPVAGTPDDEAFGSSLVGTSAALSAFAFGGPRICDPCFPDGSVGIPVRLPNGQLIQGMAGSEAVADPEPAGEVRKHLSADGSHFVFGSEQRFEPAGQAGALTIYDRNLQTDQTQVASTLPNGTTMSGQVAQLDISADGRRILIGRYVRTDAAGNDHYDLYMHVGTSPNSVLIADTANGVLYNGMSADGSRVYFTTADALDDDGDTSADLFRAQVGSTSATVERVSTGSGGAGQSDACTPTGGWNASEGGPDCSTVAISGGGGVAAEDGTVYFFSPEQLDGNGAPGEPNLFVARPGDEPEFVATLEVDNPAVEHGVAQADIPSTEDFQVTAGGEFAAFPSRSSLTGYPVNGHTQVYRYDVEGDTLACVSCAPTGARAESDAALPGNGAGISADGRVFFTTAEPLNLRDLNESKTDVYQWGGEGPQLISTGVSEFDSRLLSVSEDGRDVYFFTHDVLVPGDRNGNLVKIYDARQDGGFYVQPAPPPCKASDECHGPGTQAPPPPDIGTYRGTGGQATTVPSRPRCRGKRVRRRGRCVKKNAQKRRKKGRGHRRRGKHRG